MFIPNYLIKIGTVSEENQLWLKSLPDILKKVITKWDIELGSLYLEDETCSYVVNCLIKGKRKAVLKIGLPHKEALHEIDGLKLLNGNPAVEVLNFDSETNSMLLERAIPGYNLNSLAEPEQDIIISKLVNEIWKINYSGHSFRPLGAMVKQWNEETLLNIDKYSDPYLAKEGCLLKQELVESTQNHVLLATDLHAGNVLKAQRKNWLVIDIKPYIGDPTYDLTQHLLNCKERLKINPKDTIKRLADLAMITHTRLNDWLFARLASEANGVNQHLALSLKK